MMPSKVSDKTVDHGRLVLEDANYMPPSARKGTQWHDEQILEMVSEFEVFRTRTGPQSMAKAETKWAPTLQHSQ